MQQLKKLLIAVILLNHLGSSVGQSRWVQSYYENDDAYVLNIFESYDHGYLASGKHGANYSKYNWLIKTDINGNILWEKTIGDGTNTIALLDMIQDESGNLYLGGGTRFYDPESDPLVLKINSCGEKEWCSVFYKENHYGFASCLTLTPNGGVAVTLFQQNPEPWVDRICLAKLTSEGDLVWEQCYTTADTSQRNEDIYDIILTQDQGFLLTGFCYYEDPEIPDHWILHPYMLKTDSSGNFEWETVVFKETNTDGGWAVSTVVSPDQNYYYSSGSHYHFDSILTRSPAIMKIDKMGNVSGVFDLVEGYKYGGLNYAQFLDDSTLAAEAGWANTEEEDLSLAVTIDTLGNLLNSTVLVEDTYVSHLDITYDGKLVYASNTYQNGQFDCFLTKLNQNLEDDTIYTMPFTYDSLCPYQIVSDTIVQDDCGLIVGIAEEEEKGRRGEEERVIEVWPNPASTVLSFKVSGLPARLNDFSHSGGSSEREYLMEIYDIFGRKVDETRGSSTLEGGGREGGGNMDDRRMDTWTMDVSSLTPGLYLLVVKDGQCIVGSTKFVIAR
jgi:hypothetical protein